MQTLNFLFWNLNSKNLINEIGNIADFWDVDILILAEGGGISDSALLLKLNEKETLYSANHPASHCEKIKIFTRFSYNLIPPHKEDVRYTMRRLALPQVEPISIVAWHLPDKGNHGPESQNELATLYAHKIKDFEVEYGDKTLVIGDFNMNPFDIGMIKANGFHAMMSRTIAEDKERTIGGEPYKFFYNPMWSLLGDVKNAVSGSYHYNNSELVNYRWNIFDQVLIRPSLIANFVKESITILDSDGTKSLITEKGYPNKKHYSDHLPLFFTLKLNEL
jgi:hypothetical protein